jgi:ATP-dependent 26S proteasome regulatory subunit
MLRGDQSGDERRAEARWRLLILEDTGELLAADARMQSGQGLSRFLNVVDGLIGQGLRILVLVTTNEELGDLHPAISRPGRCAANVLFRKIPVEQANAWLKAQGQESTVSEPVTLAALYAVAEGWDVVAERQSLGFG